MENSRSTIYKRMKIYITGYGPFFEITENPSQKLVQAILENQKNLKEN